MAPTSEYLHYVNELHPCQAVIVRWRELKGKEIRNYVHEALGYLRFSGPTEDS